MNAKNGKQSAQDEWKATRLGEKCHTAYGKRSHGLAKNVTRLNENIHTTVTHDAYCRKSI